MFLGLEKWIKSYRTKTIQKKVIPNCQMSTFIKSSCFAYLMWHFPGKCPTAIKSSRPCCICLVRVTKTVLVRCIRSINLDSQKSMSLICIGLFLCSCLVLQCQWYLCSVHYLLIYLQASDLSGLSHYYEETSDHQLNLKEEKNSIFLAEKQLRNLRGPSNPLIQRTFPKEEKLNDTYSNIVASGW